MSADPSPAFSDPTDFADAGSLLVEDELALVPDWVIGAELSDAAFRVYSLRQRFGNGSGCRMPSRRLMAERMRRSVDSIDRAMRELEAQRIVRVEHRRRGRENLTSRYHPRTKDPSTPQPRGSNSGRRSAATPIEAGSGNRTLAATPGRRSAARPREFYRRSSSSPIPLVAGRVDGRRRSTTADRVRHHRLPGAGPAMRRRPPLPRAVHHPVGGAVPARRDPARGQRPTLAGRVRRSGTARRSPPIR